MQWKKEQFLGVTKIPFSFINAENLKSAEVVYIHFSCPLISLIFFLNYYYYYYYYFEGVDWPLMKTMSLTVYEI